VKLTDSDPWPTSWRLLATRKPLLSFLFLSMFLLSAADASGLAPQNGGCRCCLSEM